MPHRLWYCDHYEIPLPDGHKFPVAKYRLVRDILRQTGRFTFHPAPLATPAQLKRAHAGSYVDAFLNGTLDPTILRRIGFPWSEGLVRRSLASVGGTIAAAADALQHGWGGNLAGGTHHAFHAEGAGFCVFNDIAVAIGCLRAEGRIRRAAVIDLDVHQGDGTAQIFAGDPDVLTVSMHGERNFPFRKQKSVIDIALADRTTDGEYLARLEVILPDVVNSAPDIVFFQAGVDILASDTLGRLALTPAGVRERDHMVLSACRRSGMPCVITLGGGYSDPIRLTADAHVNTFLTAAELPPDSGEMGLTGDDPGDTL